MGNRFMPAVAHSFGRKPRRFRAVFFVEGAADPAPIFPESLAGCGFASAVHTGNGQYKFILADVWPDALLDIGSTYGPGTIGVGPTTNVDMYTQTFPVREADGRWAIYVQTKTAAVNTDPAAGVLTVWIELETAP